MVRLLAEIRKEFKVTVSLKDLMKHQTIWSQEKWLLEISPSQSESCLVSLTGDKKSPMQIFCVHPIGGTVMCYSELSRLLKLQMPEASFVAITAPSPAFENWTVPNLAIHYLKQIKAEFGSGPFHLSGWSYGGMVAFEMARLMEHEGLPGSLTLIDAISASQSVLNISKATRLEWFIYELSGADESTPVEVSKIISDTSISFSERFKMAVDLSQKLGRISGDIPLTLAYDLFLTFNLNLDAFVKHRPGVLVKTPTLLLRSTEPLPSQLQLVHEVVGSHFADAANGWGAHIQSQFEVLPVPGNHVSIMKPPYVLYLARSMGENFPGRKR